MIIDISLIRFNRAISIQYGTNNTADQKRA